MNDMTESAAGTVLKPQILIVEDEKPLLKALNEKFAHQGFRVLTAENGEKGLSLALETSPEIILLDKAKLLVAQ